MRYSIDFKKGYYHFYRHERNLLSILCLQLNCQFKSFICHTARSPSPIPHYHIDDKMLAHVLIRVSSQTLYMIKVYTYNTPKGLYRGA